MTDAKPGSPRGNLPGGFTPLQWAERVAMRDGTSPALSNLDHAAPVATAIIEMEKALALHQAWSDSERAGPDYGAQTRDTHPDGESIWRKWWHDQLDLCSRAQDATYAALRTVRGES